MTSIGNVDNKLAENSFQKYLYLIFTKYYTNQISFVKLQIFYDLQVG